MSARKFPDEGFRRSVKDPKRSVNIKDYFRMSPHRASFRGHLPTIEALRFLNS